MTELSSKTKKRLEKARSDAHERVVNRGIVQFRADKELMEKLLAISDHKKTAVGVLIRSWIAPIVKDEFGSLPLETILLPDGSILTRNSPCKDVKTAIQTFKRGSLDLTIKQYQTLCNWLPQDSKTFVERRGGHPEHLLQDPTISSERSNRKSALAEHFAEKVSKRRKA